MIGSRVGRYDIVARIGAGGMGEVYRARDTSLGRDVTVEPNVIFGPGVSIADGATIHAFSHLQGAEVGSGVSVGPFARLRPGTRLGKGAKIGNFVEVKNADFGEGLHGAPCESMMSSFRKCQNLRGFDERRERALAERRRQRGLDGAIGLQLAQLAQGGTHGR